MKHYFLTLCFLSAVAPKVFAQTITSSPRQEKKESFDIHFDQSLQLETKPDTTANASFSDFDGDGHLPLDRIEIGDTTPPHRGSPGEA